MPPPKKPFEPGNKFGKGRIQGSKNKISRNFKDTIEDVLAFYTASDIINMIRKGEKRNPLGAVDALNKLAEYSIPKRQRTELVGDAESSPVLIKRVILDDISPEPAGDTAQQSDSEAIPSASPESES